ncbi:MAG: ADP-ribosylglycohydrolase family protein [Spirochaetota bacterium]
MPAHWFYNPSELEQTFGRIDRYLPPPATHPGSILWRSRYGPTEPQFDILGGQRRYWGRSGVHYHEFMLQPERHKDTKIEECHRGFFENLRAGRKPERAAVQEKHIGGMVAVIPLYAALRSLGHADGVARRAVLGRIYGTVCYLDESMPATFYLALRYAGDPEEGLVANTMAGGDNCHRGATGY